VLFQRISDFSSFSVGSISLSKTPILRLHKAVFETTGFGLKLQPYLHISGKKTELDQASQE